MSTCMRVLVVDDEIGIREGCRRALSAKGFEVDVAENGPVGVARLREASYDVLLVDAMMPGMSGLEVLQQARKIAPDLICIIITGYATVELAVQAIREGAQDFIAKPFTAELLLQVINRELERLRLKREAERVVLLEEQNRELERVRTEMEKLAAVESRFMLTMVHVLRAPVAVLHNSLQLIHRGFVPTEEQPAILERAEQRSGELLTILDDVLLLSRLREGISKTRTEAVSLSAVLENVVAELQDTVEKSRVTLSINIIECPAVAASPDHIKALWMNLLTNAIRYTPAGGQVRVKLAADPRTQVLTATISDTGIGIAPEEIPRVFEEFYRTGEAKSMQETGTGLGLSIVQQILALYRGNLELESVPHQGSIFRFTLPLSEAGDRGVL
jgi:two-component system, sensor histidine kinase and response regulator